MLDILLNPRIMVFVCFGLWLVGTMYFLMAPLIRRRMVSRTIDLSDHVWVVGIISVMLWFTMWGFRTIY